MRAGGPVHGDRAERGASLGFPGRARAQVERRRAVGAHGGARGGRVAEEDAGRRTPGGSRSGAPRWRGQASAAAAAAAAEKAGREWVGWRWWREPEEEEAEEEGEGVEAGGREEERRVGRGEVEGKGEGEGGVEVEGEGEEMEAERKKSSGRSSHGEGDAAESPGSAIGGRSERKTRTRWPAQHKQVGEDSQSRAAAGSSVSWTRRVSGGFGLRLWVVRGWWADRTRRASRLLLTRPGKWKRYVCLSLQAHARCPASCFACPFSNFKDWKQSSTSVLEYPFHIIRLSYIIHIYKDLYEFGQC